MRRIRKLIPLFLAVGSLVALGLLISVPVAWWSSLRSEVVLASPSGRYSVRLVGRFGRPVFLLDHKVYASVFDAKKEVVAGRQIHTGDWMDPWFDIEYPRRIWVNDTTLRFTRPTDEALAEHDQVTIRNSASAKVGLLQIQSRDMFLVLDLAPGDTAILQAPKQSRYSGRSWVDVDGQFSDGRQVQYAGKNFDVFGPARYNINIRDDRVDLTIDHKSTAPPNNSLDRSGGSVFPNKRDAAKVA